MKLSEKDASLDPSYDPTKRPQAKTGTVDLDEKGDVSVISDIQGADDFVHRLHQQVISLGGQVSMTVEQLVVWLDRRIDHQDIPYTESAVFLNKAVRGLMTKHGIADVGILAFDRYRLCDAIEAAIEKHRTIERLQAFQGFLLPNSNWPLTRPVFSISPRSATNQAGSTKARTNSTSTTWPEAWRIGRADATGQRIEGRVQVLAGWMSIRKCATGSATSIAVAPRSVSRLPPIFLPRLRLHA
ncbi:MAG: hypothetical protein IPL86_06875 [Flavobacteriales bacterium]|nr:hypothetical protein [Flavobacteriales bacterium]